MRNSLLLCTCLGLALCLAGFFPAAGQPPVSAPAVEGKAPPKEVAFLELELPQGASATLDGQDVGDKRRFEYKPLKADEPRLTRVLIGSCARGNCLTP